MERQFLTFIVAQEHYGLEISQVREIIEYGDITHLPLLPPYIKGVISLRGNPVAVIELGVIFGEKPAEITRHSCIIITETSYQQKSMLLGILVDAVNEVLSLREEELELPPLLDNHTKADYIFGMARLNRKFIVMLDLEKILHTEQLAAIAAVHQQLKENMQR